MIADLIQAWRTTGDSERIAADAEAGSPLAQAVLEAYDRFVAEPSPEAADLLREAYRAWQSARPPATPKPPRFDPLERLRRLARS
ncbi:MAG: hypothetical protein K6U14_00775 [Firmicutes bacterium]|nr:hypothetical protein [Alicyclobacillaceae bacterium]MCL6496151.1 hypothetical protein [Bacillota bacterium]